MFFFFENQQRFKNPILDILKYGSHLVSVKQRNVRVREMFDSCFPLIKTMHIRQLESNTCVANRHIQIDKLFCCDAMHVANDV